MMKKIDSIYCSVCKTKKKCWELESGDLKYEKGSWETIDLRMMNIGFDFCDAEDKELHCSLEYFFDLDTQILEDLYQKKYFNLWFCSDKCLKIGYRDLMKDLIKLSDERP